MTGPASAPGAPAAPGAAPESTGITAPALGSGAMFDRIAARYDAMNRVLSFGLDRGWRRRTVRALQLGERPRVLDLATGTGDLAIDIARMHPGARVIGLDPSPRMLAIAEAKLARRGLADRVILVRGDAQQLPYANCEMDAATIAFGIRNVPDRPAALREMARVVRPGGRIAVLELGEPERGVLARAARFHTHHVVPVLGALLSGTREYRYLQRSIAAFPPRAEFARVMEQAGLHVIDVAPLTFGVCTLYVATPAEEP
ncbi:MAG TPA: bifunctional demethylmenaquinone methyltransferase/2-methoxy-6-polyprenyl-1,4-benzoquinol methylase UbiE [Kofleriaceae bacterium]|nr:bifunctional demethylmenaquinone methyltransferase/2-methoxy-6-polyprenyl-1,4-benzoquinol methylase UbiE [Kofleriaceae bacterium]